MRGVFAIVQRRFGGPGELRLEEVADPVARARQVVVDVGAAGVHLLDASIREGTGFGLAPKAELPMTPGREVAGVVSAVGPDVEPSWLGRRVVAHLGPAGRGGYASKAVAGADQLFALADHADLAEAVAMVGTGRTALAILELAAPATGDTVLVTAAAGGLGVLLVQAAHRAGATVVGAAGGPEKVALVTEVGADVAVDYGASGWPDRVRAELGDHPITLALDGVGGAIGRAAFELTAPGGRMVLYGYSSGAPMPLDANDLFDSGVAVSAAIGARIMARAGGVRGLAAAALDELAAGHLTPRVTRFPLADAAGAHRALESRATIGKVVLVPEA